MFDKFNYHWKSLKHANIITQEEYTAATFAQHYRTIEEFKKPFNDINSKIHKSGLRLISCCTRLTECPYKKKYLENINTMSPNDYAESLIPTMRSWSETVFKTALNNRNSSEIDKIVDMFYDSYLEEIANNPNGHSMDYIHIVMDIEKV
mgnify:CR=1 FL=1